MTRICAANQTATQEHEVASRQEIRQIAKKYGCSSREIVQLNKDIISKHSNGNYYFVTGQKIKVPSKCKESDQQPKAADNSPAAQQAQSRGANLQLGALTQGSPAATQPTADATLNPGKAAQLKQKIGKFADEAVTGAYNLVVDNFLPEDMKDALAVDALKGKIAGIDGQVGELDTETKNLKARAGALLQQPSPDMSEYYSLMQRGEMLSQSKKALLEDREGLVKQKGKLEAGLQQRAVENQYAEGDKRLNRRLHEIEDKYTALAKEEESGLYRKHVEGKEAKVVRMIGIYSELNGEVKGEVRKMETDFYSLDPRQNTLEKIKNYGQSPRNDLIRQLDKAGFPSYVEEITREAGDFIRENNFDSSDLSGVQDLYDRLSKVKNHIDLVNETSHGARHAVSQESYRDLSAKVERLKELLS